MGREPIRNQGSIKFGEDFEFDLHAYRLRRADRVLKVERIPLELLLLLIEKRGELVLREEIIERIWGKDVFLDTDNSINGAIRKIRQVLRDDADEPRFIQTIAGKGYRFIGPVTDPVLPEVVESSPSAVPIIARQSSDQGEVQTHKTAGWRWALLAAIAVVATAIVTMWFRPYRVPALAGQTRASGERSMLAVLPFENLTGDPGQEYFSDGLTEEIISQLGDLDPSHLGVIARTSVMHYKGSREPLDRIGKELGIQYLLEGSVRRDSNKVRITAQLIQVKDQSHIWARQYDRDLTNILALQQEIAEDTAGEIQLTLGRHPRIDTAIQRPLTRQAYAGYDLYLKGRYFWNKRTTHGLQQAIDYFQQAIAKDGNDARAYAGLADAYALLSGYSLKPQSECMPKARVAALKALKLDDRLAEAHTSLALIKENYDWDWPAAEKEYRRAIELNPNYATAHEWYAEYLSLLGRFDEALAESERARQLDPLSLIIAADHGTILLYARQYDRSIAQFRAVQEMEPNFGRAHYVAAAYVEKGQFAEALAEMKSPDPEHDPWFWAWQAYIYGRAGQPAEARAAVQKLKELYRTEHFGPDALLWAYIGAGDKDQAFVWFEKAYADHSNSLTGLKVNPGLDFLRGDPRFQELMRRVRLAE